MRFLVMMLACNMMGENCVKFLEGLDPPAPVAYSTAVNLTQLSVWADRIGDSGAVHPHPREGRLDGYAERSLDESS